MKRLFQKTLVSWLFVFAAITCVPLNAFAVVTLSAEAAYTANDLAVYIYADTGGAELRSGGVKLTYDTNDLTLSEVIPNNGKLARYPHPPYWYLGDSPPGLETPNAVDTSTPGVVTIIVGILDSDSPDPAATGVIGDRVLIGVVRFDRTGSDMPLSTTLALTLGKEAPFDNFVQTDKTVLDPTVGIGEITVKERGDSNKNDLIDTGDMFVVRNMIGGDDFSVFADCNDNGLIDTGDMFCIRNKI